MFCSLSRSSEWHTWLGGIASDLLADLNSTLKTGSCKANSFKMIDIYNQLYQRGHGTQFEEFINNKFPYVIDTNVQVITKPVIEGKPANLPIKQSRSDTTKVVQTDTNGVFSNYKPGLLTFPHRIIFTSDNPDDLKVRIAKFIADKLGSDYIIIGNMGYVEYFDTKYADIVDKILPNTREIYQYKQRKKM